LRSARRRARSSCCSASLRRAAALSTSGVCPGAGSSAPCAPSRARVCSSVACCSSTAVLQLLGVEVDQRRPFAHAIAHVGGQPRDAAGDFGADDGLVLGGERADGLDLAAQLDALDRVTLTATPSPASAFLLACAALSQPAAASSSSAAATAFRARPSRRLFRGY
jgi:hypothetical protein